MTTASEKTSINRQSSETKIEIIYNKAPTTVYKVHIKQGKFIVIDYKNRFDKKPDTEMFWESGLIEIRPHSSEYKLVDKLISDFIKIK